MTGHSLDDVGSSLSWEALGSFLHKLEPTSETARELDPELASWAGQVKTNAILADIYDMLALINANLCAIGTGNKAKKPKGYPRPKAAEKKQIGKNAIPLNDLKAWFDQKRKEKKAKAQGVN